MLRTWPRWEEAVGRARADCTSSTTGDGAEERARMLPPGRVRKTQTSYCLHPMLKCLRAFSLQHLAEVTYTLASYGDKVFTQVSRHSFSLRVVKRGSDREPWGRAGRTTVRVAIISFNNLFQGISTLVF